MASELKMASAFVLLQPLAELLLGRQRPAEEHAADRARAGRPTGVSRGRWPPALAVSWPGPV